MKLPFKTNSRLRRCAGMMLVQCLVYIFVFAIILGGAMTAFYFCWDHSRAVVFTSQEISAALHAGEDWRADVRAATGNLSVTTTAAGESLRIPQAAGEVVYRFAAGELRREIPAKNYSRLVLPKIKTSQMLAETRGEVRAWRWELEVEPRRQETHFPLRFTFEAAAVQP